MLQQSQWRVWTRPVWGGLKSRMGGSGDDSDGKDTFFSFKSLIQGWGWAGLGIVRWEGLKNISRLRGRAHRLAVIGSVLGTQSSLCLSFWPLARAPPGKNTLFIIFIPPIVLSTGLENNS